MATLIRNTRSSATPPPTPASGFPVSPAGPKKRYRPARIALAIVVMIVAGLGALYLYRMASHSSSVVQVRTDVARGATIKTTDLTTVTIGSTPGIPTVPAEELQTMVGKHARWDMTAGTLLAPEQVTDSPQPAKGRTQIGLQLTPGRTVPGDITPGTVLRLVVTAPDGNPEFQGGTENGTAFPAVLVSSGVAPDGVNTLTTVDVSSQQATTVAQLTAQGRVVVVVDSSQR